MLFIVFSRFSEFLTFGTFICSTARRLQAADPLVAWGECMQPRFKTVQYNLYLTVFQKLSNIAFREGNMEYIVRSCSANPALWLADCYVVDNISLCVQVWIVALPWNISAAISENVSVFNKYELSLCNTHGVYTYAWYVHVSVSIYPHNFGH